MNDHDYTNIISRLDRLEATLIERHVNTIARQESYERRTEVFEERIRNVEITQARLMVLVGGTSALAGVISGLIVALAKVWGIG